MQLLKRNLSGKTLVPLWLPPDRPRTSVQELKEAIEARQHILRRHFGISHFNKQLSSNNDGALVLPSYEGHLTGTLLGGMSGRQKRPRPTETEDEQVAIAESNEEEEITAEATTTTAPASGVENSDGGVWFVLEKASLEAAKVGKTYQLLNCDDHANFLRKHKRDPALYRPDITHQALLAILDSPLNKAGKLKGLYIHTDKNVLIQINPQIRIPRTFKRFCGLMVQLLQKLTIRASNGPDKLMKVVKQPVTRHLPLGARRIGMSFSAPKVVQLRDYITASKESTPLVFVVGAMSHGKIEADYIDDLVAVSEYPLSAMWAIALICTSLQTQWNIV